MGDAGGGVVVTLMKPKKMKNADEKEEEKVIENARNFFQNSRLQLLADLPMNKRYGDFRALEQARKTSMHGRCSDFEMTLELRSVWTQSTLCPKKEPFDNDVIYLPIFTSQNLI